MVYSAIDFIDTNCLSIIDMGISSADLIEQADGFAEMWPEHKYKVVKSLQKRKHIVGMTGDGVNDAPVSFAFILFFLLFYESNVILIGT